MLPGLTCFTFALLLQEDPAKTEGAEKYKEEKGKS
jgi:hypothetical protein